LNLQNQKIILKEANSNIKRLIIILEYFKDNIGDHINAVEIANNMILKNAKLINYTKFVLLKEIIYKS